MAAVLSCLVYTDSKSEGKPPKDQVLSRPFDNLMEVCEKVAGVMEESNVDIDKQEYAAKFAPEMMEITYTWCQGGTFKQICEMSDSIFEGTIIRCFRRLDELIA